MGPDYQDKCRVPDLIPLLVLVLLGELLGTPEDIGTLGFASNLCVQ